MYSVLTLHFIPYQPSDCIRLLEEEAQAPMITNQLAMSPTAHLEVNDHDGPRRVLFHAGEISIGRHPDNVLPLEGEDLSRRHCVIRAAEGVAPSWVKKGPLA